MFSSELLDGQDSSRGGCFGIRGQRRIPAINQLLTQVLTNHQRVAPFSPPLDVQVPSPRVPNLRSSAAEGATPGAIWAIRICVCVCGCVVWVCSSKIPQHSKICYHQFLHHPIPSHPIITSHWCPRRAARPQGPLQVGRWCRMERWFRFKICHPNQPLT